MNRKGPLRSVIYAEPHRTRNRPGCCWILILTLICGHELRRKASSGQPRRARCQRCAEERRNDQGAIAPKETATP